MAATVTPSATISYTCQIGDTRPAICSRLWPQTGYRNFGQLLADIMTANPQIQDWSTDLSGITLLMPTVPAG